MSTAKRVKTAVVAALVAASLVSCSWDDKYLESTPASTATESARNSFKQITSTMNHVTSYSSIGDLVNNTELIVVATSLGEGKRWTNKNNDIAALNMRLKVDESLFGDAPDVVEVATFDAAHSGALAPGSVHLLFLNRYRDKADGAPTGTYMVKGVIAGDYVKKAGLFKRLDADSVGLPESLMLGEVRKSIADFSR